MAVLFLGRPAPQPQPHDIIATAAHSRAKIRTAGVSRPYEFSIKMICSFLPYTH